MQAAIQKSLDAQFRAFDSEFSFVVVVVFFKWLLRSDFNVCNFYFVGFNF